MNFIKNNLSKEKTLYGISLIGCFVIVIIGILAIVPGINKITPDLFRYFTTLSNLLMSLTALICIPFYILCICKKDFVFPKWLQVIKMVATATVLLTFLTVVTFLGPIFGYPMMFGDFQLIIYHLVEPLLAGLLFVFIDINIKINWKTTFFVLIPVIIYGTIYLICNFCGVWVNEHGQMTDHYNLIKMPFMLVVLLVVSYFITLGIWALNNIIRKHVLENPKKQNEIN